MSAAKSAKHGLIVNAAKIDYFICLLMASLEFGADIFDTVFCSIIGMAHRNLESTCHAACIISHFLSHITGLRLTADRAVVPIGYAILWY